MSAPAALDRLDDPADAGLLDLFDPRLRIAAAIAAAIVVVALNSLPVLVAAMAGAVALAVVAGLPLASTLKRMAALELFVVPLLLFLPFTVPGAPIAEIGPWTASLEGVRHAAEIVLTANTVVLLLLSLLGTLEPVVLGHALGRLRVPESLVHLLLFTVRYVGTLHQEYGRLRLAMRARAFRARGNGHTWRSFGWLLGMLLVRSVERAERIMEAMRCRGFAGRYHALDAMRWRPVDWLGGAGVVFLLAALMAAETLA